MSTLQIGVIGLGKFGLKFAETMMDYGHDVLGIDHNLEHIKHAQDRLTQVFQADATDKAALEQMGIQHLDHVLISVGDSIAASTMIAMYLKELRVPKIWAKAITSDHEKLLGKVGVDEVIIPEYMAAQNIASRIAIPGFIDNLPFDSRLVMKELAIKSWRNKTLRELDLTNRFSLQAIAVKHKKDQRFSFIPKADDVLREGDALVVIGRIGHLVDLET